jgi:sulfotransferase famil protein
VRRTRHRLLARRREEGQTTVDHSSRVHFIHVGKTGGTALTEALLEYRDDADYEILLRGHAVTLGQIPPGENVMFILRDPLSRFVSGFNGRLREDLPRYHYPWTEGERRAFERFETPDELATALSSGDEAERLAAEDAMQSIGHVNTPYAYWFGTESAFRRRLADVFFIAFQERLDADFERLKRKLRLPEDAHLPAGEEDAHRTPAGFSRQLSETARANLRRWYARDVAFVALCSEIAQQVNEALPL